MIGKPNPIHMSMPQGTARLYAKLEYMIDTATGMAEFLVKQRVRPMTPQEHELIRNALGSLKTALGRMDVDGMTKS